MEANPRTPRDHFEGKEHFEIPAFQRPYVWNEEDQLSFATVMGPPVGQRVGTTCLAQGA